MHIEEDFQPALDAFYPFYYRNYLPSCTPRTRPSRTRFPASISTTSGRPPYGPLFVGSPQQIVDKILWERELFGHQRYLGQVDIGGLPFAEVARVTELFAAKVAPVIRGAVGR